MTNPTVMIEATFASGPAGGPWLTLSDTPRGVLGTGKLAGSSTDAGFWTDLADRASAVTIRRGRQRVLAQFEAGQLFADLDNSDRALDVTNLAGPYVAAGVSLVVPMRPVRCRVTGVVFDAQQFPTPTVDQVRWTAPYVASALGGADLDITIRRACAVQTATQGLFRVRQSTTAARDWYIDSTDAAADLYISTTGAAYDRVFPMPGIAGLVGREREMWSVRVTLDADNGAGGHTVTWTLTSVTGETFTASTTTAGVLVRNKTTEPLRVSAIAGVDLAEVTVWAGNRPAIWWRAHDWPGDGTSMVSPAGGPWTLSGGTPLQARPVTHDRFRGYADDWPPSWSFPEGAAVALSATDGFKVLARVDRTASAPVGAGELSGARINRVLDAAGWPATDRRIDTGLETVQATTLAANVLTELRLTSDTERGGLYVDGAGRVVFRDRAWRSRSRWSRWVLADDGTGIDYEDVRVATDDDVLVTHAEIARAGGTSQVVTSASAESQFLRRAVTRTDLLMETDAAAAYWAQAVVHENSSYDLRFESVTLRPTINAELWPLVMLAEFGDRLTIVRTPPGGGSPIRRDVFVEGIEDRFVARGGGVVEWQTVFALSDASRWDYFVLDDGMFGVLGTNALG